MPIPAPRDAYADEIRDATATLRRTDRQIPWLFAARGLSLLGVLVLLAIGLGTGNVSLLLLLIPALGLFLGVAFAHEHLERRRRRLKLRCRLAERSLAQLDRRWSDIGGVEVAIPESHRATSVDLDLFGRASLFRLIDFTRTSFGTDKLRDWLLHPASPRDVLSRQEAVRTLAANPEYGLELRIRAESVAVSRRDRGGAAALVGWAESDGGIARHRWLGRVAALLAGAMLLVLLLLATGMLDPTIGGWTVLGLIAIDFLLTLVFAARIHDLFDSVAAKQSEALAYRDLFEWAGKVPRQGTLLATLADRLAAGDPPALDAIRRLSRITAAANLRRSGIFGLVYLVLQFTMLWDFHWLVVLERWRSRHGRRVREWFETVGTIEALASLGKLGHDEPTWTYPTVVDAADGSDRVIAEGLGHPLLPAGRVENDVTVGPAGTVLLVTGSNMSGKSTLLRAIGINVVLAQAGAPVCARRMSLPPLAIETSMRIGDSLAEGVSFYMAELKRLAGIVSRARERAAGGGIRTLYLLDEILQGTNSRERHIAVTRVVAHLIGCGAIGAISSHDLELATAPDLIDKADCVHFRESFVRETDAQGNAVDRMTFDYRMRQGTATTTNALALLRIVGLDD